MLLIAKMCCLFVIENVGLGDRKSNFVIEDHKIRIAACPVCFKGLDILITYQDRHQVPFNSLNIRKEFVSKISAQCNTFLSRKHHRV